MSALEILLQLCLFHNDYLGSITSCSGAARNSASEEETTSMVLMEDGLVMNTFPNPFSDALSVQVDGNATEFADITVYDVAGRIVDHKEHQPTGTTITVGQQLANGMYILEAKKGPLSKRVKVSKTK